LIGADPNVLFVEPNYVLVHQQAVITDTFFANCQLWGMYGPSTSPCANAFGSNATSAWQAGSTCSSTVHISIIDEGVQVRRG
jgi:hypothetical protein